jgi:hypothetical protein
VSKGAKILLIVLGSIAALLTVTVCLFVFVIIPRAVANIRDDMNDPVAQRKLAASIANFDIPPGYKQRFGTDMLFMKVVYLAPVNPQPPRFTIAVQRMDLPFGASDDPEIDRGIKLGLASRCKNFETNADEIIHAKTRSIALHILKCRDAGSNLETAFAWFRRPQLGVVTVTASGDAADFDLVAVRRLLASVR